LPPLASKDEYDKISEQEEIDEYLTWKISLNKRKNSLSSNKNININTNINKIKYSKKYNEEYDNVDKELGHYELATIRSQSSLTPSRESTNNNDNEMSNYNISNYDYSNYNNTENTDEYNEINNNYYNNYNNKSQIIRQMLTQISLPLFRKIIDIDIIEQLIYCPLDRTQLRQLKKNLIKDFHTCITELENQIFNFLNPLFGISLELTTMDNRYFKTITEEL
ncbi:hypothetical protein RFI_04730, partial [Reticulomyxa filosa]